MSTLRILCRREWRRLLYLPASWVSFVVALFTFAILFTRALTQTVAQGTAESIAVSWATALLPAMVLLATLVTPQLFCYDREQGISELMSATPISTTQLVLSKFIPLTCFQVFLSLLTIIVPLLILPMMVTHRVELGSTLSWIMDLLLLWLLAGCISALVLLISTMFESRVACGAVALFVCCGCPLIASQLIPTWFTDCLEQLEWLSPVKHLADVGSGLLHPTYPVALLVFTVLLIRLTIIRHECLRLKGKL